MVEFALVLPLVVLVLLGAVEVVSAGRTYLEAVNAAREGARRAATVPDPARAAAAARAALGPEAAAQARVAVTRPHVVGAVARVEVSVPHRVRLPLLGGPTLTVSARAAMRVER